MEETVGAKAAFGAPVRPLPARPVRAGRPARSVDGFTIVETLMAMVILMVALLAAAFLFERGLSASRDTRNRVVAAQLASQAIESLRGPASDASKFTGVIDPAIGQTVTTKTVNGLKFTVTQDVQWVSQSSSTSLCDAASSSAAQLVQVSETVTWVNMKGTKPVRTVTALTPPVGSYSSSTGAIAVKVLNSSGQPSGGINVGITGAASDTQVTTTQGCAFFAYLPAGAYNVQVIDTSGIGDQETLNPSQSAAVVVGQITAKTFSYDRPNVFNLTGWTYQGWSYATATVPATNIPVSVANTGLQPYFQYTYPASSATYPTGAGTVGGVYPYASGYVVFAGSCKDNNPLGKDGSNNPYYPTMSPPIVATAPAGTSSAPIPLYTLAALVKNGATPVNGATVQAIPTATYPTPNNLVCTTGGASGSGATLGLATTNTTGSSVTGVPLGHYTIKATSGTKTGSVNVWVKPDGVYQVDANGNATTILTGPITVTVA